MSRSSSKCSSARGGSGDRLVDRVSHSRILSELALFRAFPVVVVMRAKVCGCYRHVFFGIIAVAASADIQIGELSRWSGRDPRARFVEPASVVNTLSSDQILIEERIQVSKLFSSNGLLR